MSRREIFENNYIRSRRFWDERGEILPSTVAVKFYWINEETTENSDRSDNSCEKEVNNNGDHDLIWFPKRPVLKTDANYTFNNQELAVTFSSDKCDWRPVSFFVCYYLSEQTERVEEIPLVSNIRALDFRIDLKEFDRHCLDGRFTVKLDFVFDDDEGKKVRTEKYAAEVSEELFVQFNPTLTNPAFLQIPYFQNKTLMRFGRLGQYFISEAMANLYNAKFQMDLLSSEIDRDLLSEIK